MMRLNVTIFLFLAFLSSVLGQQNSARQFVFLDDWTYELIDYWLNNESFSNPYVLNQPYTVAEIEQGITVQTNWSNLLKNYYRTFYGQTGFGQIVIYGRDNFSFVTDANLPVRKGLQAAPVNDILLFENRIKNHYNFSGQFNISMPHISLVNRTMINSEFLDDPHYPGDTNEWIFGRINDAYLNVNFKALDLFLGRTDRNWGALSSPGLILSNNPYSYDHAQISYTSNKLKFTMLISRLEDLLAVDSQGEAPDSLIESRKFLTAHRVDISVSNDLQFALTEIAVYGGPDRDFELGFLNPMNYFYLVQRNNRQQINGIWALDLFYKPQRNLNVFLQFLLDDIIINNEPGQDDRAVHPDRLGVHLRLSQADWFVEGLQTGIEYTRLSNHTYQSFRTWENFHYREKSLGYPTASIERVALEANYFGLFPAILKFHGSFERAGDVSITEVFPDGKEPFPTGVVEKTWTADLDVRYLLDRWAQLTAKIGFERFSNYKNVPGDNRSNLKLILGVHLNFALTHRL